MSITNWKTGLLLATVFPVILGIQAGVIRIVVHLAQRPAQAVLNAEAAPVHPASAAANPVPRPVTESARAGEPPEIRTEGHAAPDAPSIPAVQASDAAVPVDPAVLAEAPDAEHGPLAAPVVADRRGPDAAAAVAEVIEPQTGPGGASEAAAAQGADRVPAASDATVAAVLTQAPAGPGIPPAAQPARSLPETPDSGWLQTSDPTHFTLQIQSGTDLEELERFASREKLPRPVGYYRILRERTAWYALVAGEYPDHRAAEEAAAQLKARLPKLRPWIRNIGGIPSQWTEER